MLWCCIGQHGLGIDVVIIWIIYFRCIFQLAMIVMVVIDVIATPGS